MSKQYYENNAQSFFESTINVDMSPLYAKFTPMLKSGALIIDAGCGSGRDTKAFLEMGYRCVAFDASQKLTQQASEATGIKVLNNSFLEFTSPEPADAIWACASLLHVEYENLAQTFLHLCSALKQGGYFYCSFKLGSTSVERNGRRFTNLNRERLQELIATTPLQLAEDWITGDLRDGRESEQWYNAMLLKQ